MELNKIYNEDCYEAIKKLEDNSVDCVYTDVPYLYQLGGGGKTEIAKRISKNKTILESHNIVNGFDISKNIKEWMRVMKKVNMFIWCSKLQILDIMNEMEKYPQTIYTEILVWVKSNPVPQTNNTWVSDIEYCLYFREKGVKLNDGFAHKLKSFQSSINVKDKKVYEHPTIKPLKCVKNHLAHATQPNDIILDPYMGSGTTGVAAKQLDRRFIGYENVEKYCNIANDRIKNTKITRGYF